MTTAQRNTTERAGDAAVGIRLDRPVVRRHAVFGVQEANAAAEAWGFNCGPGALCAVLGLTPDELRPKLGDFEAKGYTNPTLMAAVLRAHGVRHRQTYRSDLPGRFHLAFGLMRVQWAGPWTQPDVPMAARYRQTHWVAVAGDEVAVEDVEDQLLEAPLAGDGRGVEVCGREAGDPGAGRAGAGGVAVDEGSVH